MKQCPGFNNPQPTLEEATCQRLMRSTLLEKGKNVSYVNGTMKFIGGTSLTHCTNKVSIGLKYVFYCHNVYVTNNFIIKNMQIKPKTIKNLTFKKITFKVTMFCLKIATFSSFSSKLARSVPMVQILTELCN